MRSFPTGTRSVFARAISAEVRARIGADRSLTGQKLARAIGLSQNYVAKRLRDEAPFTADDIERLSDHWEIDPEIFVRAAVANHWERIDDELTEALWDASADAPPEGELEEPSRDRVHELFPNALGSLSEDTPQEPVQRGRVGEIEDEAARRKRGKPTMGDD